MDARESKGSTQHIHSLLHGDALPPSDAGGADVSGELVRKDAADASGFRQVCKSTDLHLESTARKISLSVC